MIDISLWKPKQFHDLHKKEQLRNNGWIQTTIFYLAEETANKHLILSTGYSIYESLFIICVNQQKVFMVTSSSDLWLRGQRI